MPNRIDQLLAQIKLLERELVHETLRKEAEFSYRIRHQTVRFAEAAKVRHRQFREGLGRYLRNSRFFVVVTAPVIWMCLIPVALMDLVGSLYQAICFPIYGIPKVRRRDYVALDRHHLSYLNLVEKLNCDYCGYVNGILAYFTEIAARTEQHWCPIKHARCLKCAHSRYRHFFDFGDAETYRAHVEEVRRSYGDLTSPGPVTKSP